MTIGDEKVVASAATAPPSAPAGVGGLNDVFNLVRACESAVRRLGWRSSDYSLGHEARMLAQDYENGAFQTARETLHALVQQPAAVDEAMVERVAISIYAAARGFSAEVAREKWPSVEQKSRFTGPARAALGQETTND